MGLEGPGSFARTARWLGTQDFFRTGRYFFPLCTFIAYVCSAAGNARPRTSAA